MTRHLSDEEMLDLAETGAAAGREHAASCAGCRGRIEEARTVLVLAGATPVPEPSPLYWGSFRREVGRRIVTDAAPRRRMALWGGLAAVAASAVAVLVLQPGPPQGLVPPVASHAAVLQAWSALPPSDEDPGLLVLSAVEPLPAELEGSAACAGVADCVAGLSDDESVALAALLRREMPAGREL